MSASNREIQLRKTCELYAYVLRALGKEVSQEIQECADSYDYLIDYVQELSKELQGLDSSTLEKILYDKSAAEAHDLANWWEMYQLYMPVPK